MDQKLAEVQSPRLLTQSVEDLVGRPGLVWMAPIVRKPLLGDFKVGLRNRKIVWIFRNTVPKRLQIAYLLGFG